MEGLVDRLQRIEAKVDLLATKADLHYDLRQSADAMDESSTSEDESSDFATSFAPSYKFRQVPAAYTPTPPRGIFGGGNVDQTIIVKGFDSSLPDQECIDSILQIMWRDYKRCCSNRPCNRLGHRMCLHSSKGRCREGFET
ncbi:unnamed protein product [Arabis nemorensis]|uniref:Uncharacterized protein n=1 Tax=Arabis nemorensis TaxID=586526 RepID=A0A565B828_9BRAS|nr:unnamed protein product [Arabis nemorensis]